MSFIPNKNLDVTSGGFPDEAFARLEQVEDGHWWFKSRNHLILHAIGRYFSPLNEFLEIGCGTGFVLQAINEANPKSEIAGTELFDEGLEVARKRLPTANLTQMDARNIDSSENLEVVGAFDVLEHIPEDKVVLANLFQAIRTGGGIIITVPQHPRLWSPLDDAAHHVRRYTRKELVAKVIEAGFKVKYVNSFVSLLVPLMFLSRKRKASDWKENSMVEFHLPPLLNRVFTGIMSIEHGLIRLGVNFPIGGSLLLVAKKL